MPSAKLLLVLITFLSGSRVTLAIPDPLASQVEEALRPLPPSVPEDTVLLVLLISYLFLLSDMCPAYESGGTVKCGQGWLCHGVCGDSVSGYQKASGSEACLTRLPDLAN